MGRCGRLHIAYTNQLGKTNGYVYDSTGRKTSERTSNGELLQYTYAAAGDLLTLQDGLSQTTTWGYDAYGRVISKKYANVRGVSHESRPKG